MNIFTTTRFRLTAWYTVVITAISLLFSIVIYRLETTELARFEALQRQRIESHLDSMGPFPRRMALLMDQELIRSTENRLLTRLGFANGVIIVLATGLGYFLAGRTLAPIENMVKKQEQFIGDASHELRTPLTSLTTNLEVFLREKKPTLKEATSLIQGNLVEVKRLHQLADSLLTLSQLDNNQKIVSIIDLRALIKDRLELVAPMADKNKLSLISRLSPITLSGDQDQISTLVTILLDNAIKYAPPKNGRINLTLTKQGKSALIKVKDNGIGIAKHDLPHIFNRFYRADSARSRKGESGGYGLGLAIAKQIVSAHNGTIHVESKLGKGSTFTVSLPA